MKKLVLYCKSYKNDVLRVKRLAASIAKYNVEQIPFYVSVPTADMPLFQQTLAGENVTLLADETIISANPALDGQKIDTLKGWLSQQIVKSEFWRLGLAENYLCLDSDCQFIRPFTQSDFITPDGYPYTIMHEAKELLQFAIDHDMQKVCDDFHREHQQIMNIFGRGGRHYEFGFAPLLWSRLVWQALDEQFLKPKGMNFYDAIMQFPGEMQWYGEAMLKFQPFPLMPVEPFFKVYHYERQYNAVQSMARLASNFLGVCYQSNWEKQTDFVKKPLLSRLARWIRRNIFRSYR